jgi:hypothetical protein
MGRSFAYFRDHCIGVNKDRIEEAGQACSHPGNPVLLPTNASPTHRHIHQTLQPALSFPTKSSRDSFLTLFPVNAVAESQRWLHSIDTRFSTTLPRSSTVTQVRSASLNHGIASANTLETSTHILSSRPMCMTYHNHSHNLTSYRCTSTEH